MIPFVIPHCPQYLDKGGYSLLHFKSPGKDDVNLTIHKMRIAIAIRFAHTIIYNRCILAESLLI